MLAKVGQPAPAFTLPSTKGATSAKDLGKEISLSDYNGKWLIFFFYPLDFTFVCPTEITALSDRSSEFKDLDTEVLGASTDSVHSHFAWLNTPREKNGIAGTAYPLVADFTKEVARAYGVLDEQTGAAQRGLFIIDPDGVLRYAVVTDDNVGRCVEETMRVLQALQTGGLCPAEWTPGKRCSRSEPNAVPLRTGSRLPSLDGVADLAKRRRADGRGAGRQARPRPLLVGQLLHLPQRRRRGRALAGRVRPARARRDRRPPAARPRGARRRRGDRGRAGADGDHLAAGDRQRAHARAALREPVRAGVLRLRRATTSWSTARPATAASSASTTRSARCWATSRPPGPSRRSCARAADRLHSVVVSGAASAAGDEPPCASGGIGRRTSLRG